MPQQTETATRTRICKVADLPEGQKVRVAGRVLSYDVESGLIILIEGRHGLLIDSLLSLDNQSSLWATERLSTVIALGRLEYPTVRLKVPTIPSHAHPIKVNENLVLRAILILPAPDLDLKLWNAVLIEEEEIGSL
ncbi:hypothetical protein CPB84DRAFT_1710051 [Gymnopilus junonius]|uniref:Uncharacterized protein n=1 Tax=Gymnopilus junonius TaxID=109634 RepID=A0A9P5NLS1_GYMJU|nr:hypothetical protein CPB84DRAFT_1710051 [Gymnopilus junonius]